MKLLIGLLGVSLLSAQTAADLTKVFEAYLAGVKAKDFNAVTAVYRAALKEDLLSTYDSPQKQQDFLRAAAEMAPDSISKVTVEPAANGGATMKFTGAKRVPPAIQKAQKLPPVMTEPMVVDFVNEEGAWKMGPPRFASAPPPPEPKRPKDLIMGARSDYGADPSTQLGGPILRMEKQAAGTVYVIGMLGDEVAVFAPASVVQPAFTKGKVVVFHGSPHKEDPQKFWAESAKLYDQ